MYFNFNDFYVIVLLCKWILVYANFTQLKTHSYDQRYDYTKEIVNPHDFEYIINPQHRICQPTTSQVFLLIYVHTSPSNLKNRLQIRETFSRRSQLPDVRVVFMMGEVQDLNIKSSLELEFSIYQDIVQENFIDSYHNLTYKGIMAMKWINQYCSHAKYILKIDDDIIVDIFRIKKYLQDNFAESPAKSIMCNFNDKVTVNRNPKSKWYVSEKEFTNDHFRNYCAGMAFILTNDMPKLLYEASFHVRFMWVDDFYLTGLLIKAINGTFVDVPSMYAFMYSGSVKDRFMNRSISENKRPTFGHLGRKRDSINLAYSIWEFILKNQESNATD